VTDTDLNLRMARLLGHDPLVEDGRVLVDGAPFDPVHDNRPCDPITDRYGVELQWAEGVWCAQAVSPAGRPVEIDDALPTRAVVRVVLAAHGG
jgi:hypothetical protein